MSLRRALRKTGLAAVVAALLTAGLVASAVACGGADSSNGLEGAQGPQGPAGAAGSGVTATPPPRAGALPTVTASGATATPRPPTFPADGTVGETLDGQVAQAAPQRIIVRNVDMAIEAQNVASAIADISLVATGNGGWVVRTQNTEVHSGQVDIRVPAERLDSVLTRLREIAARVRSEVSTSQDFTEEFTDASARIRTLQDTIDALRSLYARAEEIEDALTIQREITRIQADLESLQARVNFLSESAAFSLVKVRVSALPQAMEVAAGEDVLAAAGRPVRFRAEFTPPEGIDNLTIEWDFGDGSPKQSVNRVAPVDTAGRVISAPISYAFPDDTDSPYIVRVRVTGTGPSGAAEGEDVMVVTVTRVPVIDVFAGETQTVEAGRTVKFRGSFTRPEGVTDLAYTWDFGDGSTPQRVEVTDGSTVAEAEHAYVNSRTQPYDVVLRVSGQTDAGSTSGSGSTSVRITPAQSLSAGTFDPGGTSKDAVRALSAIGSALGNIAIWLAIFSPVWIALGAVVWAIWWNNRRSMRKRRLVQSRLPLRPEPPQA